MQKKLNDLKMRNRCLQLTTAIFLLMCVVACKKENDDKVTFTMSEATEISENAATFNVSITSNATITDKGICYSSQNAMPTTENSKISKGSGAESYSVILTGLTNNTAYYVRPYAMVNGEICYGERKMFTTLQEEGVLINGVRWATRNVDMPGAFAKNPEDAGMFYQWNRKTGWSTTDPMVNSDGDTIWDHTESDGNTWEKVNDPCPAGWHVPTISELESLINADFQWTTVNGVTGCLFGSDESFLFLPIVGIRRFFDGRVDQIGTNVYYWSSSIRDSNNLPYILHAIYDMDVHTGTAGNRAYGNSVRCVKD